jgi:hypothetical protein
LDGGDGLSVLVKAPTLGANVMIDQLLSDARYSSEDTHPNAEKAARRGLSTNQAHNICSICLRI